MRWALVTVVLAGAATAAMAAPPADEIAAFNRALSDATRKLDNAAVLALWEDDGVSLLPATVPMIGKKAIAHFLDEVMAQMPHARMLKLELQCFDIQFAGRWASEWCTEHQVVQIAAGKPPFDGRGKMLLVLHKGDDGGWRVQKEMWNQAAPADGKSP